MGLVDRCGIWLSWNNQEDGFELPVLPAELNTSIGGDSAGHEVAGLGKISVIKDRELAEYTIESFFPAYPPHPNPKPDPKSGLDPDTSVHPYITAVEVLPPMVYVRKIMKWWETKRPIRFVFVGGNRYAGTSGETISEINTAASIESFEWKEVAGSPGDISYSLRLKEYRFYAARKTTVIEQANGEAALQKTKMGRPDERVPPATYTLVAGDSLWKVAQKMLGDGSRWREIQKLNGINDAQLKSLPVGKVLKLPSGGGNVA